MNRLLIKHWALLFLCCSFYCSSNAQLRLGAPFSDHMVLQRNSIATIWGWSEGGNSTIEIKVSWNEETYTGRSNDLSKWQIQIPTPEAGGPYQININNSIILKDILIGEVWLCSGQSNMQWSLLSGIDNAEQAINQADNDQIRLLSIPRVGADAPQIDIECRWQICSSKTMSSFSAVAYFFGKTLQESENIPIGLIHSSWGGTSAEVWTPKDTIENDAEFSQWATVFSSNGYQPKAPGVLYNAMIHPLVPFDIAGAIWYQGEANTANPFVYRRLFPTMIKSWRQAFSKDFPFYFVQLAPFKYNQPMIGSLVQEAQLKTLSAVENVGMAVINDIGNVDDIHPRNKLDVGKRLAYWALNKNYGRDVVCSGPIYKSFEKKGNRVVIHFDYNQGLYFDGKTPKTLFIAGADGQFLPANATIEGDKLVVSHPDIPDPEAVRYAFSNAAVGNLKNAAGLPASPFRTDNRPIVLTPVDIQITATDKKAIVYLKTKEPVQEIRYTLDGSTPGEAADVYSGPITLDQTFHLKTRAVVNGQFSEAVNEKAFIFSKATFAPVALDSKYNERYCSSGQNAFTDGFMGSKSYADGHWQGYYDVEISATVDLGKIQKIDHIETHFLKDQNNWIFLPNQVTISISKDGTRFETIHTQENQLIADKTINIQAVEKAEIRKKARFVRITASNAGPCPDWHPGAGGKSWIFMDEVIVD